MTTTKFFNFIVKKDYPIPLGGIKWWLWQVIILGYFLLFFEIARLYFIIRNAVFADFSISDILLTFIYGFRLDLSMAAYCSTFIFICSFLLFLGMAGKTVFKVLLAVFFIYLSILTVSDAELYIYWGFKIDKTVFNYLNNPNEAFASISILNTVILGLVIAILSAVFIYFSKTFITNKQLKFRLSGLTCILYAGLMFIFARGSIDASGVNISTAYFSHHQVLNHTAVNANLSFFYSLLDTKKISYNKLNAHSLELIQNMYNSCDSPFSIIKSKDCNLIIVILESFTSRLFDYEKDSISVIPNLKRIQSEGYFFPNCYSASDRSDKGLGALFSGFPAHPRSSILLYPEFYGKTGKFAEQFRNRNYQSRFYYGGNSDFANYKAFLINNGFEMYDQQKFERNKRTSRWGVPDDFFLERVYEDIRGIDEPFLVGLFTLSSHPPFDIPHRSIFYGEADSCKFLNSINFTDSVTGVFYDRLKSLPSFDNTLIVFVSDHGNVHPNKAKKRGTELFRIPLIFAGGALKEQYRGVTDNKLISQTDIPFTLLKQFELQTNNFIFSNNFLCHDFEAPVFYVFNYGFGIISSQNHISIVDKNADKVLKNSDTTNFLLNVGQAWFDFIMFNFHHQ